MLAAVQAGQAEGPPGGAGVGRVVGDGAERAQQCAAVGRHPASPPALPPGRAAPGRRYAAEAGLSGRISQRGRRVPSGDTWPAGRVSASQRR